VDAFVKADPAPLEAAGLRWLAEAGARVPAILEEAPGRLVLERVAPGRLSRAGEEDLGRMLAAMHRAGARAFGTLPAPGRFFIGRCELASPEGEAWPAYYAEHRLLPLARRCGMLDVIEPICARIEALAGPPEPVARLHGDLWGGNVLAGADGLAWLIDPAAYGGHREVDLAMLELFGSIPARTLGAYEEVWALAEGWRERIGLWQLLPLLVHVVLFGGHYAQQTRRVAASLA
jgi:fructosamine-3-kinase